EIRRGRAAPAPVSPGTGASAVWSSHQGRLDRVRPGPPGGELDRPAEVRRGRASLACQLRGAEGGAGRGGSGSHPGAGAPRGGGPRADGAALRRLGPAGAGGGVAEGTGRTGRISR